MDRRIGTSRSRARSSASSPHGYQSTGFSACWRRYGLVSFERRFGTGNTLPVQLMRALAVAAVIPWIPTVPPTPLSPAPAAPCVTADLHAELELQGATGSLVGGVLLTNRGSATCSLLGPASAKFVDGEDPAGVKLMLLAHKPH